MAALSEPSRSVITETSRCRGPFLYRPRERTPACEALSLSLGLPSPSPNHDPRGLRVLINLDLPNVARPPRHSNHGRPRTGSRRHAYHRGQGKHSQTTSGEVIPSRATNVPGTSRRQGLTAGRRVEISVA